jgi:hypothetical protein
VRSRCHAAVHRLAFSLANIAPVCVTESVRACVRACARRSLFVAAEVDMAAACLISDKDLMEIGILQLGVRKKLLHAVSQLPEQACGLFMSLSC